MFAELQRLDSAAGYEYDQRKYEIIHDLAEAQFFECKLYLVQGLDSHDPDYRWAVISALVTHWQQRDPMLVAKLVFMAESDPDDQVRLIAISSLGSLRIKSVIDLLRRIATDQNEEADIQKVAVGAIEDILDAE